VQLVVFAVCAFPKVWKNNSAGTRKKSGPWARELSFLGSKVAPPKLAIIENARLYCRLLLPGNINYTVSLLQQQARTQS